MSHWPTMAMQARHAFAPIGNDNAVLADRASPSELRDALAAALDYAPVVQTGMWWCDDVNRIVDDGPVWDHGGGIRVCPGPHHTLIIGPEVDA